MQLLFNTKVKLPQPLFLQFVCNQGNHSVVKTANLFLQFIYIELCYSHAANRFAAGYNCAADHLASAAE